VCISAIRGKSFDAMVTVVRVFARAAPGADERSLGEAVGARCRVPVSVKHGDAAEAVRELRFILDVSRQNRGTRQLASLLQDVTSITSFAVAEDAAENADVRALLFEAALEVAREPSRHLAGRVRVRRLQGSYCAPRSASAASHTCGPVSPTEGNSSMSTGASLTGRRARRAPAYGQRSTMPRLPGFRSIRRSIRPALVGTLSHSSRISGRVETATSIASRIVAEMISVPSTGAYARWTAITPLPLT
jgi:hypothetical protein